MGKKDGQGTQNIELDINITKEVLLNEITLLPTF
jgi:hypothetical protein